MPNIHRVSKKLCIFAARCYKRGLPSQLATMCGCLDLGVYYHSWSEPRPPLCPSSVRRHSTGYDSFDEFADVSTTNRQPWFTPLLRPGSTIAICCWPEHQSLLPTSCSGSRTLQRELWAARRSTTAAWHTCFTLSCIGSMWQIESHTSWGDGVQVLAWPGTGLSIWAVYTGRSSCWTTASSFRQPPSTRCFTVLARYVRPSHLRCRWTNDMELDARSVGDS